MNPSVTPCPASRAGTMLERGMAAHRQGSPLVTRALLRMVINRSGHDLYICCFLGHLPYLQERLHEAAGLLATAVRRCPGRRPVRLP